MRKNSARQLLANVTDVCSSQTQAHHVRSSCQLIWLDSTRFFDDATCDT